MEYPRFMAIVDARMDACLNVLDKKAETYAHGAKQDFNIDRLGSFKRQAENEGCTPMEALRGQMGKHYTALMDFIMHPESIPPSEWYEKLTDIHNYLYLLEGLFVEMAHE